MGTEYAVEMKNITKTFGTKVVANKNINFQLKKGEILSLLGGKRQRQDDFDEYARRNLLSG